MLVRIISSFFFLHFYLSFHIMHHPRKTWNKWLDSTHLPTHELDQLGLRRNSGTMLIGLFWFQINWGCCCWLLDFAYLSLLFDAFEALFDCLFADASSLSLEIKTWPKVSSLTNAISDTPFTSTFWLSSESKSLPADSMYSSFSAEFLPSTSFG